ncbi:hypothetical protein R4282_12150 [Rhodococcus oxybenzonivorans]|uniref:hypothetical protein n=1 Tax=Rhodococcus oxybenzonivorans TaxID=1990687 RepID=UPI002953DD2F|nr:hypothetical protein [Rhodococcus oxybenzonivorans]MDV7353756.1 hypothetical protein [Rhodococcus oxybenzonivorans]
MRGDRLGGKDIERFLQQLDRVGEVAGADLVAPLGELRETARDRVRGPFGERLGICDQRGRRGMVALGLGQCARPVQRLGAPRMWR